MTQENNASEISVIARAPFHVYFEGKATAVTATNAVGKFDVLPGHADFFSVLSPGKVTIETKTDPINFDVSDGIMTVRDNEVMLFVNM
jgi:F0F1-type ATP synthase epsilon subunit